MSNKDFSEMKHKELLEFILTKHRRKVLRTPGTRWRHIDSWEYRDAKQELFNRLESSDNDSQSRCVGTGSDPDD